MRRADYSRRTAETDIRLILSLEGTGLSKVSTGYGFFDHMLTLFTRHSLMDLELSCNGDLEVDTHHTVEDTGIALGTALAKAIGDKESITRYGSALLPMDETLVMAALDFSGRPFLVYDTPANLSVELQVFEEFFRALAFNAGITLHIKVMYGTNGHHIMEAVFKAVARALRQAMAIDPREKGIPSTKGVL